MKLATRLWLAILAAVVLLLSTIALVERWHEEGLLVDVTLRDRRFFGHALQAALSFNPSRADPLAEARAMLEQHDLIDTHAVARLVSLGESPGLGTPRLSPDERASLARGEVVVGVVGNEVLTYVPLSKGDHAIAVEFAEKNAPYQSIESVGLYGLATQLSAVGCVAGLIMYFLVRLFVARPIAALTDFTREIAAGNLGARTPVASTTELRELAREMNRMAESLQGARQALDESEAERVVALESLRHADRLRTVGQLATALAHELGTPLNVVTGYARMIEDDAEINREAREHGKIIGAQAQRMTDIVRMLLDYSRREPPCSESLDLVELVRQAGRTLDPLLRKREVELSVASTAAAVPVVADSRHLMQVFTNLLVNAIQAIDYRGTVSVVVRIEVVKPPLGRSLPTGTYAIVEFSDTGSGIADVDLPRLFEPFFSRKPAGEGTGLGLSVAAGIVTEHGGWIDVESEVGRGTIFRVYLPVSGEAASGGSLGVGGSG